MMLPHPICALHDVYSSVQLKCHYSIVFMLIKLFNLTRSIEKIFAMFVSLNKFIIKMYSTIYLMILKRCLDSTTHDLFISVVFSIPEK